MVKIDIKEFCMSGKPGFLSHACSGSSVMKLRIFNSWLQKLLIGILAWPHLRSYERVRHGTTSQW